MREETRQDIISAEEMGTKYDEAAKEIWKNREILAPLLKYSVEELKDESVESIMKLIANVKQNFTYNVDSWKKTGESQTGIPFLQIYAIGLGRLNNICLTNNDFKLEVEAENNHLDTWLPLAQTKIEKYKQNEINDIYNGDQWCDSALTYYN